ncbi:thiamine pyrophosphate-binding protein [Halorussus marinus]|uniref:thiamine pyrophosphate-binding protein n=1 Tax=Halorussus marinus TaxID=2505976 RepID=UPI00143DEFAF|nr:5-guanidino-2-oxopentanoate decarboxylase [Halorussus marinus]
MPRLTGGEAVVAQLEREGVDVAFGIPGVHTLDVYDPLLDSDIDHVTTRHEQGAGFMADGYARTTGRIGVALVITGPGLTNAATPIGQAYSDSSPLLVVSSQNETNEDGRGKGYLHELKDQQGAMESIAAYSEQVTRVADVPEAISDAVEYLRTRRPRPVHVQIPTDVLAREERVELAAPVGEPSPDPVDETRLAAAVDRLAEADRPLLVVGGGASGAADAVRRLVDAAGVPVVSTVAGKGVVPADHPLALGATTGREPVAEFVESRDLAIAIGTELSPREFESVDLPETLVQIDIDYRTLGKTYPTEVGIVADAAAAVPELADRVESRGVEFGDDQREAVADLRARIELGPDDRDGRHRILAALRAALDDDAVVVNDMTKVSYAASSEFPVREPDTFLFPRGFGTLGFGPPAAFGAAVGSPDTQVVGLVGDGGFLFTVQALATAVKHDLAVPIVVVNDDCYGVLEEIQARDYDGRIVGTDIENPEFVPLARAFGAAAERVDADAVETELPAALEAAFARDRPTVVEIPVDF